MSMTQTPDSANSTGLSRERLRRARDESIEVTHVEGDLYRAVNRDSDSEYLIDVGHRVCSCPDHTYRGVTCKHLYRALEVHEW